MRSGCPGPPGGCLRGLAFSLESKVVQPSPPSSQGSVRINAEDDAEPSVQISSMAKSQLSYPQSYHLPLKTRI